jgi:dethiobiotin synthetase
VTVLLVSGTGTGVGKTVVTAALAALVRHGGRTVAVVKPAQTGLAAGEPGDLAEIARLAGLVAVDLHEPSRFAAPLAPAAAAREAGRPGPDLAGVATLVRRLVTERDVVLVEGAGGLLVHYDETGWTIADLATALAAPVVLVTDPGLGTLNHTELCLEALAHRRVGCAGVVLGSWPVPPDEPDLAMRSNLADLEEIAGSPLSGALPARASQLSADAFAAAALAGLGPGFGGRFDAADFRSTQGVSHGVRRRPAD